MQGTEHGSQVNETLSLSSRSFHSNGVLDKHLEQHNTTCHKRKAVGTQRSNRQLKKKKVYSAGDNMDRCMEKVAFEVRLGE